MGRFNRHFAMLVDGGTFVADEGSNADDALGELLEELPPIPTAVDESLRAKSLGPPPEDIPLP